MDAEQRAALVRIKDCRELLKKVGEHLDWLEKFASSEAASQGHAIKAYLTAFDKLWEARYKTKYVRLEKGEGARDAKAAKKLLAELERADLWQRTQKFIASSEPYYVEQRHPFWLFARDVNKFGAAPPPSSSTTTHTPAVQDCRHTPRCASDVEHTRRRSEDMRRVDG